ncbi:hypothetical protein SKAU_G00354940 [Synaphobranchus kaupii]|uniref:Uncharacterized protein n=1 Tax=Synaphobranchus kaupii TaxID=118154 RepID=A0A9Q1EH44_SYNKA|nr:hypothetical protein SKAU_G00354940 [Synaphobranchus kaupii]
MSRKNQNFRIDYLENLDTTGKHWAMIAMDFRRISYLTVILRHPTWSAYRQGLPVFKEAFPTANPTESDAPII